METIVTIKLHLEYMFFQAHAMRYPRITGAIASNSKELAKFVTKKSRLKRANVIVEVGPGAGVFTKEILRRKKAEAKYFGIEINGECADKLKKEIPGVNVINDSAESISEILKQVGRHKCDRIISSLPWTAFEECLQNRLIEKFLDALEKGGIFTTFSYYPFNKLPAGRAFKEKLKKNFSKVDIIKIDSNIPPAFVYVCKK